MSNLIDLPDSKDEYWDGSKETIDMNMIKNSLCEVHNLVWRKGNREMNCSKCGFGFSFIPNELDIREDKVYTNKGKLIGDSLTIL